jgi:hypothetical protein
MGEPILRLPILLQFDMLTQHLTDSFVPRDPPPVRNYSQGIESTRWKPNIGLLITWHAASINDATSPVTVWCLWMRPRAIFCPTTMITPMLLARRCTGTGSGAGRMGGLL